MLNADSAPVLLLLALLLGGVAGSIFTHAYLQQAAFYIERGDGFRKHYETLGDCQSEAYHGVCRIEGETK